MSLIKKFLFVVAALCCLLLFAITLLPITLSTAYGKDVALRLAGTFYKGKIEVDALSLGWLSGAHVKGLRIEDEQGGLLAECAEIKVEKPLLNWAFSWDNFGNITISSPSLFLRSSSSSTQGNNKHEIKTHSHHKHKAVKESLPFSVPSIKGSLSITDAKIVAAIDKKPLATLSDGSVDLSLDLKHDSKGSIHANLSDDSLRATPLSLTFSMQGDPLSDGKASFSFNVEELPTDLLGALVDEIDPKKGDLLREALGSSLSYKLDGSFSRAKADVTSHLSSRNFVSHIDASFLNDTFSLKQGSLLKGTITPTLAGALCKLVNMEGLSLLKEAPVMLENTAPFRFDTKHHAFLTPFNLVFSTPEPVSLLVKGKDPLTLFGSALISGTTKEGNASAVVTVSSPHPAKVTLDFTVEKKENRYSTSTSLTFAGAWPQLIDRFAPLSLSKLFGKTLNAEIKVEGDVDHLRKFSLKGTSSLTSPILQHAASFSLFKDLDSPLYHLSSQGSLAPFQPNEKTVDQMTLSLDGTWNPDDATAKISKFSIASPIASVSIAGLSLSREEVSLASPACFSLHMDKSRFPHHTGGLAQFEIFPCTFKKQKDRLVGKPLEMLASGKFSFQNHPYPFEFKMPLRLDVEHSQVHMQPVISSQNNKVIEGDVAVSLSADDGILRLVGPGAHFEATCTPEHIKLLEELLQRPSVLTFKKPFTARASVPSLQLSILPLLQRKEFTFAQLFPSLKLKASLFLSELEIASKDKDVARIASLSGELDVDGEKQRVDLRITPEKPDSLVAPEAVLSVKDFMGKSGPEFMKASIDGTFKVRSLPLRLVDFVAPGKGELAEQVVGSTCSVQGALSTKKMERGDVQCEFRADHAHLHLDGSIKEGNLLLNTPATASLELTKNAGELLFKGINPLLASAAHSENPISITVDSHNVSIPLKNFSLNNLTLPKVTVDAGKIVVKNGGALKIILALLKLGQAANSEELNLWLTPLHMEVNHGFVNCLRADALVADELHLITWGTADLVRDNLDMTIAIPQETLHRLGVQVIGEHGLQIPVRGPSSNPKIDVGRATAKLAGGGAMTASKDQRVRILGGLIQAAASIGEEEKPIPAPTTQPLPWEKAVR